MESWRSDPALTRGDDFHDCIARLFIRELDALTQRFLRKDFVPVRYSAPTIRGKVLTTLLCRAMHRLPNVPQLARNRTFDTQYNIVLALALDKVPILMSDEGVVSHRDYARLKDEWADISREVKDVISAVTHAQWACPPGYRNALQLARLILIGAVVDSRSGAGGQAFTLSLAPIWEAGVRKVFEELQATTGWNLLPSTIPWADATDVMDKNRWMTADVHAERDGIHWVLDTKYRCGFGDESRSDRFQVCGYALGFSAQRATLVYPTGAESVANVRLLLNADMGGFSVTVDSIELPMAMGPGVCKEAVRVLCDELASAASHTRELWPAPMPHGIDAMNLSGP